MSDIVHTHTRIRISIGLRRWHALRRAYGRAVALDILAHRDESPWREKLASVFDEESVADDLLGRNGRDGDMEAPRDEVGRRTASMIGAVHDESLQAEDSSRRVKEILAEKHDRSQDGR